ncbi:MAG: hypothetical protein RL318_1098 [Fibrobacterota bacterium]|jgi:hypothetical protein
MPGIIRFPEKVFFRTGVCGRYLGGMRKTWEILVLLVGVASAQMAPLAGSTPSLGLGSPMPVTRSKALEVRQSYSLSYAATSGASASQGTYLTQLSYRLASPLTFHLDAGMATPLYSSGMNGADMKGSQLLLPRVGLEYRPTESTVLSLNYCRMPANAMGLSAYGPYWGDRLWP